MKNSLILMFLWIVGGEKGFFLNLRIEGVKIVYLVGEEGRLKGFKRVIVCK